MKRKEDTNHCYKFTTITHSFLLFVRSTHQIYFWRVSLAQKVARVINVKIIIKQV